MDSHSRWDEVKAKRRPSRDDVRAPIELALVQGERTGTEDEPRADSAGGPTAPEA
jgi:hypothetical protein